MFDNAQNETIILEQSILSLFTLRDAAAMAPAPQGERMQFTFLFFFVHAE
jgi:hypothetical protein